MHINGNRQGCTVSSDCPRLQSTKYTQPVRIKTVDVLASEIERAFEALMDHDRENIDLRL